MGRDRDQGEGERKGNIDKEGTEILVMYRVLNVMSTVLNIIYIVLILMSVSKTLVLILVQFFIPMQMGY